MKRDARKDAILEAAKTWHVEWTDQKGKPLYRSRQQSLDGQGTTTLDAFGGTP